MNEQYNEQTSISLNRLLALLLHGLKKLWLLVLALTVLGGAAMGAWSWYRYTPSYTASVTFTVYVKNDAQAEIPAYNKAAAEQMAKTFPYILTSGVLSDLVMADLNTSRLPSISASAIEDANLFVLKVSGTDPEYCYEVLQSVIKNYPQVAELVVGPTQMEIVDETGVPTEPSNTRQWQSSAKKGAVIGLVLGLLVVVFYGYTKTTVMSKDDLRRISNIKFLGALPGISVKKRSKGFSRTPSFDDINNRAYKEAFRAVSVRVDRNMRDKDIQALMVCSAASGEGKTTVVYNLAQLLVKLGRRVLIIDCDLRNPTMYRMFGESKCKGFFELVEGKAELAETVHAIIPNKLNIIFAGECDGDATDVLSDRRVGEILSGLRPSYDYILIDTPPYSMLADAENMGEVIDGAMMVVRQNYASRVSVVDAVTRLSEIDVPVVGYILNACVGGSLGQYGYGYGYGDKESR